MRESESYLDHLITQDSFYEYVTGTNKEAIVFWQEHLLRHPEEKEVIEQAAEFIKSLQLKKIDLKEEHREYYFRKLEEFLRKEDSSNLKFSWKRQYLVMTAAVIALVLASSVLVLKFPFSNDEVANTTPIANVEKYSPRGQKLIVTLKDGSRVKLNSESSLISLDDFGINERSVRLKGEAFFEVTKDESKPFIIETETGFIRVLGTSFGIRANSQSEVKVAVVEGIVQVDARTTEDQAIVIRNQMATLSASGEILTGGFDYDEMLGWNSGVLYFKEAAFPEVMKKLELWYGVSFKIEREANIPEGFTGRYENPSLKEVLNAIGYTSNFEYEIIKNIVYIK